MLHALIYHGSLELNRPKLAPGTTAYASTDGKSHAIAARPAAVDGIVVGYMERAGKRFSAVRMQFEKLDIVLANPVALDPMRHMGNKRFSAEPVTIDDEHVGFLIDDALARNPKQQPELALLVNRVNHVRRGDRESIE
jgi:hypothetical protein